MKRHGAAVRDPQQLQAGGTYGGMNHALAPEAHQALEILGRRSLCLGLALGLDDAAEHHLRAFFLGTWRMLLKEVTCLVFGADGKGKGEVLVRTRVECGDVPTIRGGGEM